MEVVHVTCYKPLWHPMERIACIKFADITYLLHLTTCLLLISQGSKKETMFNKQFNYYKTNSILTCFS